MSAEDPVVPLYYYSGNRKEQIIHTRLRLGVSDLNYDLFNRHLIDDPLCACGSDSETADHYLLSCPRFRAARMDTILKLPQIYICMPFLLKGSQEFHMDINMQIFEMVQKFISKSNRF